MVDSCACNAAPALRLACAGAADAGALADQAARPFTWEGAGIMLCLTGIGGRLPGIAKSNEAAVKILVIDGWSLDHARRAWGSPEFSAFNTCKCRTRLPESPISGSRSRCPAGG